MSMAWPPRRDRRGSHTHTHTDLMSRLVLTRMLGLGAPLGDEHEHDLTTKERHKGFIETKKHSPNTGARANNRLQVTRPLQRRAC